MTESEVIRIVTSDIASRVQGDLKFPFFETYL
jgi:hypothetical protein